MCGRYAIEKLDREYIQFMRDVMKAAPKVAKARYNVAPSQDAPILRIWDGKPKFDDVRWQLYEAWWKNISRGPMINARADKVFTNSMYKHSMAKRRCLVLATGWYEWPKKPKNGPPHFIHKKDSSPVMFAGIWSTYHSDEKKIHQDNFAIITTEANKVIEPIHDRMPVIISPKNYEAWLDPDYDNVKKLDSFLAPYQGRDLCAYPVSSYVNSPKNTEKTCLTPLTTDA